MQQRKGKQREESPVVSWFGCAFASEITVMAASGLWQDLREGLGQAELICGDLLEKSNAPAWCGQVRRRVISPDLAGLFWQSTRRGGERL